MSFVSINWDAVRSRFLDLLIVAFWLWLLMDAYDQGAEIPSLIEPLDLSALSFLWVWAVAVLFCLIAGAVTFWQRIRIMNELPLVTSFTDRLLGKGAYQKFTNRVRPIWTVIVTSLVLASSIYLKSGHDANRDWINLLCLAIVLYALSMLVALLFSIKFPPQLK